MNTGSALDTTRMHRGPQATRQERGNDRKRRQLNRSVYEIPSETLEVPVVGTYDAPDQCRPTITRSEKSGKRQGSDKKIQDVRVQQHLQHNPYIRKSGRIRAGKAHGRLPNLSGRYPPATEHHADLDMRVTGCRCVRDLCSTEKMASLPYDSVRYAWV